MNTIGLFIFAITLMAGTAHADENFFGYTYGAETLPKGKQEFYQWITSREGKSAGAYQAYDLYSEYEFGLSERSQMSVYLNFAYHNIDNVPGMQDLNSAFNWTGVQTSYKYNVLSPYKEPIGLALYIEPAYKRLTKVTGQFQDEIELETKVIFQKNFMEDQMIWALNLTPEFEFEHETEANGEKEWEPELALEVSSGLAYQFVPRWLGGLEAVYRTVFEEYKDQKYQGYFFGPAIHYTSEAAWWFTFTYLPQISGRPDTESGKNLMDFEETECRLKVGYNF